MIDIIFFLNFFISLTDFFESFATPSDIYLFPPPLPEIFLQIF